MKRINRVGLGLLIMLCGANVSTVLISNLIPTSPFGDIYHQTIVLIFTAISFGLLITGE